MSSNPAKQGPSVTAPQPRGFRRRYIAAVLVLIVAVVIYVVANDGSYNPSVEDYYNSLESRLGYKLLLDNTRHCGLYPKGQLSPFPISKYQRLMEEKLYTRLGLKPGSKVLDAGAGSGKVAIFMARKGLNVQAIDITPIHVQQAKEAVKDSGLEDKISVNHGDYHDLSSFADASFDGIYTMETFVHADDAEKVLRNFYRLLKSGGALVLHEADFSRDSEIIQKFLRLSHCQNTLERGSYERLLKKVGFKNFSLEDLTENVLPMWRLFGVIGYVPYQVFKLFGVEERFTNVLAGVETWLNWKDGRYISIRVVKP